jgi:alpha-1,2-glucosyltransferase
VDRMLRFIVLCTAVFFGPFALHGVQLSPPHRSPEAQDAQCEGRPPPAVNLKTLTSAYTYMDELFHVPQTLQYSLLRNWTAWDPMITTPPGAYVFGTAASAVAARIRDWGLIENIATPWTSVFVTACRVSNGVAILMIYGVSKWGFEEGTAAMQMAVFPPLLFFGALYYTEPVSTLCIVAMLALYRRTRRRPWWIFIAAVGFLSITVRQTNIVWLFFVSAHFLLNRLFDVWDSNARPGRIISAFVRACASLFPCIVVAAAFAAFIVWNDFSIVLGDKTQHMPVLHGAQLAYLFSAVAVFTPVSTAGRLWACRGDPRAWATGAALVALYVALLQRTAVFHPYLVADNRHFTNVLYRHVLRDSIRRTVLAVPAAAGTLVTFHRTLLPEKPSTTGDQVHRRTGPRHVAIELLLALCCAAATVPQALLEPRYFVAPFVVIVAHRAARDLASWRSLDCAWGLLVNAAAVAVFVGRPFTAPDGSVGRMMW